MKNQLIYLKDYKVPDFLIPKTHLSFDIRSGVTQVCSRLEIVRNPKAKTKAKDLVLNGISLKLLSVSINGHRLSSSEYFEKDETLTLRRVPDRFSLEIQTEIYPEKNKTLMGLYESRGIYCTQCESHGFRRMTYYLDRPDVLSRFTVEITADAKLPVLLSNGNLIESKNLENGRKRVRWEDPFPKPCYLFALVAGDLGRLEDSFVTRSKRKIALRIYLEKGNEHRAHFAMESLKHAMKWDEETFGLEYDLDLFMIAAVDDFNFGAMENKGLNLFNSQYVLADPSTATDQNFKAIEGVIGHEYFHNWTGNRVTCRDWFQITLKEGLTVFRDQEFSADMNSRALKRIEDVRFLKDVQFAEDAGPNSHPIQPKAYLEVNNFYTATVYQKGAEIIRMIETLIGPANFKKGITKYFELFDGGAVTTRDFVRAMELASKKNLSKFLNWYDQKGTPICEVRTRYLEKQKTFEIRLTQKPPQWMGKTPAGPIKALYFPFKLALFSPSGKAITFGGGRLKPAKEQMLVVSKKSEVFRFKGISERPVPSLLRNFSAPVKLESDLSDAEKLFLVAHDTDPVNRYEAAQSVVEQTLLRGMNPGKKTMAQGSMDPALISAFEVLVSSEKEDPAFIAECLIPPSESLLLDRLKICEFEAVHHARLAWMKTLASTLKPLFLKKFAACESKSAYSIDSASMGRRMLKNVLLKFLFLADPEWGSAQAYRQYQNANNMTDGIAAMAVLTDHAGKERSQVFADFYEKWKKDPLVINKWFALQAASDLPDVLETLNTLEKDPAFNPQNPNKARALYGMFTGNYLHFHHRSGNGYAWISDRIIQIDDFNPGLAARLSGGFRYFSKLNPVCQKQAKKHLQRILSKKKLSKDVFEIVSKTLGSASSKS